MIILHLGVQEDRFLLWGEVPRGKISKSKKVLPYAAPSKQLITTTADIGLRLQATKALRHHLWLPTQGDIPLPSSPMIADVQPDDSKPILTPWPVPALPLSTENTIDLLASCYGQEILAPGILIGSDLQFFTNVLRFAGALTAQQQFLPNLSEESGKFQAVWEPVIVGEDTQVLSILSNAMPHACRAFTKDDKTAPDEDPNLIISRLLKVFVNYLVRLSWTEKQFSKAPKPAKKSFDSLHDQWIHALCSWNSTMSGDSEELEYLAQQIKSWQRPLSVTAKTPFRLCFRLEEPEDDLNEQWFVRYLLNATDDPSLYIEVADAWVPNQQTKSIFAKYHANIQEYLLLTLGHVSTVHPIFAESLKTNCPGGADLDTRGAYTFLNETAWLLQQAGYHVQLPSWWTASGARRQLSVKASVSSPKMQSQSGISLDTIVDFDWQLSIGDDLISMEEIEALTQLKMPLVQIRGQWMRFDADAIQEAIRFWKKMQSQDMTARDAVQMAIGSAKTPEELPFDGIEAAGWVGDLLYSLNNHSEIEEIPISDLFDGTLRPYQSRGYSWLTFMQQWGFGVCLADDMGLGKTPQTLAMIQRTRESNPKQPILVVSPTSVIGNWQKEAAYFTPNLSVLVHHGMRRIKKPEVFKEEAKMTDLVLTGFPLLHRDFEILNQIKWSAIVLDEAQNIKNPGTKQAKAARALDANYRVALTGTPVENNVGELWSIMEFLNPGMLHSQAEFKRQFFIPIQVDRDQRATQLLKQITGPFILRRLKTDRNIIDDLPEKQETNIFTKLTKEQGSLYRAVVKEISEGLKDAEDIQRKGLILATLMKLKQICNHPAQFLHDASEIAGRSGKLTRLLEMLEEVYEVGDRALIFTQFTEMGEMLRKHLQETFGREVLFLHGGVPKKKRDRMIERFQHEDMGPQIFLLSLKAAGTGLNLTRANHVFHYDRWWNPAVENQATDRAFRIGQTKHVQVYKFVCSGTIEEHIHQMIEKKREVADSVVSAGEQWITELSTRDLKNALRLQKEAVE